MSFGYCLSEPAAAEFRCLAEIRPGFAMIDAAAITGPAIALCRIAADAAEGAVAAAKLELVDPDAKGELPKADLAFLSKDTFDERDRQKRYLIGPPVFIDPISVLAPQVSPIHGVEDLRGAVVCIITGSEGQRALEARFAGDVAGPIRLAFRENVELLDAFDVGRCDATVAERSYLIAMQASPGVNDLHSRLLDETLDASPILAGAPIDEPARAARIFAALDLARRNRAP